MPAQSAQPRRRRRAVLGQQQQVVAGVVVGHRSARDGSAGSPPCAKASPPAPARCATRRAAPARTIRSLPSSRRTARRAAPTCSITCAAHQDGAARDPVHGPRRGELPGVVLVLAAVPGLPAPVHQPAGRLDHRRLVVVVDHRPEDPDRRIVAGGADQFACSRPGRGSCPRSAPAPSRRPSRARRRCRRCCCRRSRGSRRAAGCARSGCAAANRRAPTRRSRRCRAPAPRGSA